MNGRTNVCFCKIEQFRSRALKFPGLISGCTLDWFQPWPREALIAVAHHSLGRFQFQRTDADPADVERALAAIQESVAETAREYFQRSTLFDLVDERIPTAVRPRKSGSRFQKK